MPSKNRNNTLTTSSLSDKNLTNVVFFVTNENLDILSQSPNFFEFFSVEKETIKNLNQVLSSPDMILKSALKDAAKNKSHTQKIILKTIAGIELSCSISVSVFYHKDEKIFHFGLWNSAKPLESKLFKGINKIHSEVYNQWKNGERLTKILSEFDMLVYRTSHDLRTPITNILGLIELMENEKNIENMKSYLQLQESSVRKVDNYIHQIVNLAKSTRLPTSVNFLDLKKIFIDLKARLKFPENHQLNINFFTPNSFEFLTDGFQLSIALESILNNAIRFMDTKKGFLTIEITISLASEDTLVIKIKDNGIGIDEIYQNKVFDMFYRAQNTQTGVGLGLYIAQKAIQRIGGTIKLNSQQNIFTELTLTIPNLLNEKMIYLVDDDIVQNMITAKCLEQVNVLQETKTFFNGRDALLDFLEGNNPDIIFLDLNMPIMDGWSFLDNFDHLSLNTKVFLLTSSLDEKDKLKSAKYKCVQDYLVKPLSPKKLQEAIAKCS